MRVIRPKGGRYMHTSIKMRLHILMAKVGTTMKHHRALAHKAAASRAAKQILLYPSRGGYTFTVKAIIPMERKAAEATFPTSATVLPTSRASRVAAAWHEWTK